MLVCGAGGTVKTTQYGHSRTLGDEVLAALLVPRPLGLNFCTISIPMRMTARSLTI